MRLAEWLRRLDDAVVGPPVPNAEPTPMWVRLASVGAGQLFVLAVLAEEAPRSRGWLVAAIVYGSVGITAFIAAARWHYRHNTLRTRGRFAAFAAFPVVIGAAIIIATILAPAPWARSQVHYARGCQPASPAVVEKIRTAMRGGFRVDRVAVFGSPDAAAATALVSGTLTIGGLDAPMTRQPADFALAPGPLAAINDLAARTSPQLPRLFGTGPIGSPLDQLSTDRGAAENCALALR